MRKWTFEALTFAACLKWAHPSSTRPFHRLTFGYARPHHMWVGADVKKRGEEKKEGSERRNERKKKQKFFLELAAHQATKQTIWNWVYPSFGGKFVFCQFFFFFVYLLSFAFVWLSTLNFVHSTTTTMSVGFLVKSEKRKSEAFVGN